LQKTAIKWVQQHAGINFCEKLFTTLSVFLYLNKIYYQDAPYNPLNVCQI